MADAFDFLLWKFHISTAPELILKHPHWKPKIIAICQKNKKVAKVKKYKIKNLWKIDSN